MRSPHQTDETQAKKSRLRVAVVSPTLDKRHGTERCVAEEISRLTDRCEFHLYSSRAEDIDLSQVVWHRIPSLPGPLLAGFLWWFFANQAARWWHERRGECRYDLVYSPGINCLDADVISVHIVFAEFRRQAAAELAFGRNPIRFWPRLLHRRLYYALAIALERRVYRRRNVTLLLTAHKTGRDLAQLYGRSEPLPVSYLGLDHRTFNPQARASRRAEARQSLGLREETFALLLIGNDWKKKGLATILEALAGLDSLPLCLLVAGRDDERPYRRRLGELALEGRVRFLPPRPDVEFYYAAADAYVGPSLEDAYALPPAEAMACGLPVVISSTMGVAEIVTDGRDGIVLDDPRDASGLREKIRRLYEDPALRRRMGENACRTTEAYTWERNAGELYAVFEQALARKLQKKDSDAGNARPPAGGESDARTPAEDPGEGSAQGQRR
jgi:UDP-glucose:(heptosyl)LPS alpha-1,3-glucosyltransferase